MAKPCNRIHGPGLDGMGLTSESSREADCAVCGKHFVAYTGLDRWPYKLTEYESRKGIAGRICCSWGCLTSWRKAHEKPKNTEGEYAPIREPVRLKKNDEKLESGILLENGRVMNFDRFKLINLRGMRNWTRKKLSDRAHIHFSSLTQIENGEHKPKPTTITKLAEALGVQVQDLLKIEDG